MTSENWQQNSVALRDLSAQAKRLEPWGYSVFDFLRGLGIVPWDVLTMPRTKVRLTIDPDKIPAGYLASCAYEWDSWGDSQPSDFIGAIDAELNPEKRDFVTAILTSLGRTAD